MKLKLINTTPLYRAHQISSIYSSVCSEPQIKITNSRQMFEIVLPNFEKNLSIKEIFVVAYLNRMNKIIGIEQISEGGVSSCIVDTRLILRTAIELLASSIILFHNHPTGNNEASTSDKAITNKIKEGCRLFDIVLMDHIIVLPNNKYVSFMDEGIL